MSKQKQKKEQPTITDELLEKGQVTLIAHTREELNEQFAKIASEVEGAVPAGAVSDGSGCVTLRIDLIKQ